MKKIYALMAFGLAVATIFSACHPLNSTYNSLDAIKPAAKTLNYTLIASDYKLLPSTSNPYKYGNFLGTTDANASIPAILNAKFFDYPDGSNANITFTPAATASIVQADSVYKDLQYTLVNNSDYLLLPGNKYADFSVAQLLTWLPYKFTTPVNNQQEVLTWIFYPTLSATAPQLYPGVYLSTTGTTTTAVGSFIYLNGAWVQAYYITPAQYAAVGRGQYNQFTSSDDASLISYLNGILKTDASVAATAKTGAVQYVSFNYYSSAKVTSQRIIPLVFDGTNWSRSFSSPLTLTYLKSNGSWIPDPTVYYTLQKADFTLIGNSSVGTAAGRSNYASYGDFNQQSGSQYYWSDSDIQLAIQLVLKTDFPNPIVNNPYKISYLVYTGSDTTYTVTYIYNGTAWVQQ